MFVPTQEFVLLWQASADVAEVSRRTGLSERYCSQRASRLRMAGRPLKRFNGNMTAIDVPDPATARKILAAQEEAERQVPVPPAPEEENEWDRM